MSQTLNEKYELDSLLKEELIHNQHRDNCCGCVHGEPSPVQASELARLEQRVKELEDMDKQHQQLMRDKDEEMLKLKQLNVE